MDEDKLVSGLRDQDPEAIQEVVSVYGDRLLRSAFLLSGSETEAQDLVQETFLQGFRSIQRFYGGSSLYTWLHAILLNLTRHYHRSRSRLVYEERVPEIEIATPEQPGASLDLETGSNCLDEALRRLSFSHREVLVLRFYEGLKIHEIAQRLGVSAGTVKSRLHHAIGQMQKLLPSEMNLFGDSGTKGIEKR
jgi:RNA polymerase sigma-70 factor (ECF subfamily)